ncbi:hypothetical protein ABE10_00780, partial [Bacillus toyonensis]|nr:hypothetical protein [Bacillus toyonensis]
PDGDLRQGVDIDTGGDSPVDVDPRAVGASVQLRAVDEDELFEPVLDAVGPTDVVDRGREGVERLVGGRLRPGQVHTRLAHVAQPTDPADLRGGPVGNQPSGREIKKHI